MKSNQSVDLSFIQDTRFQLIRLYYIQKKIGASVRAALQPLHLAPGPK